MRIPKNVASMTRSAILACGLAMLCACGGGGGSGGAGQGGGTGGGGSDTNPPPPPPAATYTLGGTVTGLVGSGLTLRNGTSEITIESDGDFTFANALADGAGYDVSIAAQPSAPVQVCSIENASGAIDNGHVTDVMVSCPPPPAATYTLGGTVTGLIGTGLTLRNGATELAIASDGAFAFPDVLPDGTAYDVSIAAQPNAPAQVCSIENGSGIIDNGHVTDVMVSCPPPTAATYALGGTVTGLLGSGLTLRNGTTQIIITSDGAFAFPDALPDGTAYDVVIVARPSDPVQSCRVYGGIGAIDNDHITDVLVACADPHTALQVATSAHFTCVLRDDRRVKCWGRNAFGQLGLGDSVDRGAAAEHMAELPAFSLDSHHATQIAVGGEHACALLEDGRVKCWGLNHYGQLGLGDDENRGDVEGVGFNLPSVDLGAGRTAIQLAAGFYHTCALLDNAQIKCWGLNAYGQLGLGDTNHRGDAPNEMGDALAQVALGSGRSAVQIAAGFGHTCALLDNAQIKCWGRNQYGQLGLGDTNFRGDAPNEMGDSLSAIDFGAGRTATQLAVGQNHTCALLDNALNNKDLKCWGSNSSGQLGLGDTADRGDDANEMGANLPVVVVANPMRTVVQVAAGSQHTCVVMDNGRIKCWGSNDYGQLGLGDTDHRGDEPDEMGVNLPLVDLDTAVSVTVGTLYTCARLSSGHVKCWGINSYGQLGLGDTDHRGDEPDEMGVNLPIVDLGPVETLL